MSRKGSFEDAFSRAASSKIDDASQYIMRQQLQQLLDPEYQARVQLAGESIETAPFRRRKIEAETEATEALAALRRRTPSLGNRGSGAQDPYKRLQFLEKITTGESGLMLDHLDKEIADSFKEEIKQIRSNLKIPVPEQDKKQNEDSGVTFKVREKSSGKTGTIDQATYNKNPGLYEKL